MFLIKPSSGHKPTDNHKITYSKLFAGGIEPHKYDKIIRQKEWCSIVSKLLEEDLSKNNSNNDFCIVFADIDGAKHINAKFQLVAGDAVLRTVSKLFAECFPGYFASRIGPDEFCCFLPNTYRDAAESMAWLARKTIVETFDWDSIATGLFVSLTLCVSEVQLYGSRDQDDPNYVSRVREIRINEAVKMLDEAVIRAMIGVQDGKRTGGNRIVVSPLSLRYTAPRDWNSYNS